MATEAGGDGRGSVCRSSVRLDGRRVSLVAVSGTSAIPILSEAAPPPPPPMPPPETPPALELPQTQLLAPVPATAALSPHHSLPPRFRLRSTDASAELPSMRPGEPFSVGIGGGKTPPLGCRLEDCAVRMCYNVPVPTVLVALWVELVRCGGLDVLGIFRTAPDPREQNAAEEQLAKGYLTSGHSPEVLAYLIKSFLRRIPGGGLLGRVPRDLISACHTIEGCERMLAVLRPAERNLFEWLVRIIIETTTSHEVNKMGLRNLTIVFAPNLLVPLEQPSATKAKATPRIGLSRNRKIPSSAPASAPFEELIAIEDTCNALHTITSACMKFARRFHM